MVSISMRRYHAAKVVGVVLSLCIILLVILLERKSHLSLEMIKALVAQAGVLGPVVLICLTIVGILFSPIPSVLFIIAAGYLYGPWQGALYGYVAHVLAAFFAFSAAQKFRSWFAMGERYGRYRSFIEQNNRFLYLLFAVPILPISVLSILSASSGLSRRQFLRVVLLAFAVPAIFFSFFGNRVSVQGLLEIGICIVLVAAGAFSVFRMVRKNE